MENEKKDEAAKPTPVKITDEKELERRRNQHEGVASFGYYFNNDWKLCKIEDDGPFEWQGQQKYDALGDQITEYIQQCMKKEYELNEVFLPLPEDDDKDSPSPKCNIFMSKDALTSDKLILLVQGSGAVRAGQWARSLCINASLHSGTIFDYLILAKKAGYGIIVLNPNFNSIKKVTKVTTKSGKEKEVVEEIDIKHNSSHREHILYVYDKFVSQAKASDIVIVAHSRGGDSTTHLLNKRGDTIIPKLRAIAFTDSVHDASDCRTTASKLFLKEHACDWLASKKPLDWEYPEDVWYRKGCKCVSSGHEKHEWTSSSAINSVYKFLNTAVEKAQNQRKITTTDSNNKESDNKTISNTTDSNEKKPDSDNGGDDNKHKLPT